MALRHLRIASAVIVAVVVFGCGSSDDGESGGIPAASYAVTTLTTVAEFGELYAFNARGQAVTNGPMHHLAILGIDDRSFVTVSSDGSPLGFDDDGDLLYRAAAGVVHLRHGDGRDEALPPRIESNGDFTPFALAQGGVVWGYTFERHEGQLATPGFAALRDGVISQFRGWGTRAPEPNSPYLVAGVNAAGQIVFCKAQDGADIPGNGFPKEECFISQPDGTSIDLNPIYANAFRVVPISINARGEVAGQVDYGVNGLGGSRAFLYSPPTGFLLGDQMGGALFLNDVGDVLYSQLTTPLHVYLRKGTGAKSDLSGYLKNPVNVNREANYQDVIAMNAAGIILAKVSLDATDADRNVIILRPR